MQKSESIKELTGALNAFQASMPEIKKNATNPFYKNKYADLAAIWEAIREPLTAQGLSVSQVTESDGDRNYIETILMHLTGQWISGSYHLTPAKINDPQAMGSAMTYARRYTLSAMLGIVADDDDDGQGATKGEPKKAASKPMPKAVVIDPKAVVIDPKGRERLEQLKGILVAERVTSDFAVKATKYPSKVELRDAILSGKYNDDKAWLTLRNTIERAKPRSAAV